MLLPSSPHSQCRVCGQLQTHAAAPRQSQRTAVPPAWSRAGADAAWDRNQRASMQVGPPPRLPAMAASGTHGIVCLKGRVQREHTLRRQSSLIPACLLIHRRSSCAPTAGGRISSSAGNETGCRHPPSCLVLRQQQWPTRGNPGSCHPSLLPPQPHPVVMHPEPTPCFFDHSGSPACTARPAQAAGQARYRPAWSPPSGRRKRALQGSPHA